MNRFYVYLFLRADGTPYYVGKGTGNRQWRKGRGMAEPPVDTSRNIRLLDGMAEEDAFAWEALLIARWGRKNNGTGILRNLTDGGEGPSGRVFSEESLLKMSASQRARFIDPQLREHLSAKAKEQWKNDEHRARISEATTKQMASPDRRAKVGEMMRSRVVSQKTRSNMGAAQRARFANPDERALLAERARKQFATPEARRRLSEAKAAKSAAILEIPVQDYLAMPKGQRKRLLKERRSGTESTSATITML